MEAIIDDYAFATTVTDLTVTTDTSRDDGPYLAIFGFGPFGATKPVFDEDGTVVDREYDHTEAFLDRVAPHLAEPLVVETVGFEKCPFPLLPSRHPTVSSIFHPPTDDESGNAFRVCRSHLEGFTPHSGHQ